MARKIKYRSLKKSIVILVDGESEIVYLNSLKKQSNIKIKPELPKKKRIEDIYKLFEDYLNSDDVEELYWIIDLDVVIRERKLDKIKEYIKKYGNKIIINNPCLEFWFLLHFEYKNFLNSCSNVISYLKRKEEFINYNKSFKEIRNISKNLEDKLDIAILNAKLQECNLEELQSCSTMYKLFENIFIHD